MTSALAIAIAGLLAIPGAGLAFGQPSGSSRPGATTQSPASSGTTSARPASGDARTTPPNTAATAGSAVTSSDYRLSIGDKLRIEVYRDDQLSQSVQIRPDGKITLPLLGDVRAAGLTPLGLRDQLAESLKEYMTNPVVTVIVVEGTPATVFVMGEVKNPGPQPMRGDMTIMQALSVAGGFLDFAKTSDIRVLRRGASGTTETIKFNYKKAVKGEGEPILLRPGDIVVVP
jgi:polysaccharide export outer membrane protein